MRCVRDFPLAVGHMVLIWLGSKPLLLCVSEESLGGEEPDSVTIETVQQGAVTIETVQQAAAFSDHNVQYQFRTENSGGQVSCTGDQAAASLTCTEFINSALLRD